MPGKPYSESCDQNRDPILAVIRPLLLNTTSILEVGSGTGQHAVYFAERLPHLVWQTSDRESMLPGISQWLDDADLANTPSPIELDVCGVWPQLSVNAVFSANTTHIMHWHMVEALFAGIEKILQPGGQFLLYGPFNFNGSFSSDSNARFDVWLKARDPKSGIRDFEALDQLADNAGLHLDSRYVMPANNHILAWRKAR